ncbi:hypothetical protein [Humisphaera borealis]|uniref:Lipoprotein n=1 Tax=Humisphaera borealis TaxID=2807512 RepID=A0A7M2X115_9BACT|nr:hypothetical protein [Humisphaera borealis]QOV91354.1 hypothetical protein IPV69_08375 [Humisphaera borealis]
MRRLSAVLCLASLGLFAGGCSQSSGITRPEEFGPAKLRIHPSFTRVKDWTGDKKPDGVEAVVELLDSYNEPTRGNGTMLFELWGYKKYNPNMIGQRLGGPWKGTLLTREEQEAHWSPALRAYTFQLADDKISEGREFVLTASFETAGGPEQKGGGRLFDKLIIEPPPGKKIEEDGVGRAKGNRP